MQQQQEALLTARLDSEQYSDADLVSIKTPLQLPYYTASTEYERVHGSIDIDGVTYEYVKRRVHNDTLELLCLPNRDRMHLESAETEFFKQSLQGTASGHEKQHTVIKIALPDFCQELQPFSLAGVYLVKQQHYLSNTAALSAGYTFLGEQPPESMPLLA